MRVQIVRRIDDYSNGEYVAFAFSGNRQMVGFLDELICSVLRYVQLDKYDKEYF